VVQRVASFEGQAVFYAERLMRVALGVFA